jgi:hypothetical protein
MTSSRWQQIALHLAEMLCVARDEMPSEGPERELLQAACRRAMTMILSGSCPSGCDMDTEDVLRDLQESE